MFQKYFNLRITIRNFKLKSIIVDSYHSFLFIII